MVTADLARILDLPPDWDGYGAHPIHPGAAAARFLDVLPADVLGPCVVPCSDGNVQLEWPRGPVSLEVEFDEVGGLSYVRWDARRDVCDVGDCPTWDAAVARDLWGWFVQAAGG
jgi:hypothetical protein